MLLLLRNTGCCCGAKTHVHGGAAERDAVASMEVAMVMVRYRWRGG